MMDKQAIRESYIRFNLENGRAPHSVYELVKLLNGTEEEFYKSYASLKAIEKEVWLHAFEQTVDQLKQDEVYAGYSSREKLLAFYFLWIQQLLSIRSYLLLKKKDGLWAEFKNDSLSRMKPAFYNYVNELLKEGHATGEVKERKYVSDQYAHGFWLQLLFVLQFWLDDESTGFEQTDAAIEKAVNLSFRLVSENTLDSLLDFGKFVFQSKRQGA